MVLWVDGRVWWSVALWKPEKKHVLISGAVPEFLLPTWKFCPGASFCNCCGELAKVSVSRSSHRWMKIYTCWQTILLKSKSQDASHFIMSHPGIRVYPEFGWDEMFSFVVGLTSLRILQSWNYSLLVNTWINLRKFSWKTSEIYELLFTQTMK